MWLVLFGPQHGWDCREPTVGITTFYCIVANAFLMYKHKSESIEKEILLHKKIWTRKGKGKKKKEIMISLRVIYIQVKGEKIDTDIKN